jgi:hypothetical protein
MLGKRHEGEARGNVDDRRAALFQQMRQQGRRKANGAEDVRGDNRFRLLEAGRRGPQVLGAGDAGVIDHDVQGGMAARDFRDEGADGGGIGDIERDKCHAGIGAGHFLQGLPAPAGDDDLVAERMKGFRQAAADARAAARDENGVIVGFHRFDGCFG